MRANANEKSWEYLRRAFEYHRQRTGETVESIAARTGFSPAYLAALTRGEGERLPLSRIRPLCEAIPALLPHELLYLCLREQGGEGALHPGDLDAMRREFAGRRRVRALQRGENTSYRDWCRKWHTAARRESDPA